MGMEDPLMLNPNRPKTKEEGAAEIEKIQEQGGIVFNMKTATEKEIVTDFKALRNARERFEINLKEIQAKEPSVRDIFAIPVITRIEDILAKAEIQIRELSEVGGHNSSREAYASEMELLQRLKDRIEKL